MGRQASPSAQGKGKSQRKQKAKTHEANKEVNSCAGGAGRPSASVTGRKSKAASMFAIAIHNMSRAKKRPGQLRRPNPHTVLSGSIDAGVAGSERKRSGLNLNGSGYVAGSCRIALPDA